DQCDTAGCVTFVNDLVEMLRFCSLTRPALDGAIDVVVRHALGAGGKDGAAETGVAVGIPPAGFRRDRDFPGKLAEKRAAFGIERALEPLTFDHLLCPDMRLRIPVKLPDRPVFFREPESLEGNRYRGGKLTAKLNRSRRF